MSKGPVFVCPAVVVLALRRGPNPAVGRNDGSGTVLSAGISDLGQQSDPVQREALLNDQSQLLPLLCGGMCSLVSSRPHLLGWARVKWGWKWVTAQISVFFVPYTGWETAEDTNQSETKPRGHNDMRASSEQRPCALRPCCRGSRTATGAKPGCGKE